MPCNYCKHLDCTIANGDTFLEGCGCTTCVDVLREHKPRGNKAPVRQENTNIMSVTLYEVKHPDGKKMGTIAATESSIQKGLAELLGAAWEKELMWDRTEGKTILLKKPAEKGATPAPAATPASPPPPPEEDPLIPPAKLAGNMDVVLSSGEAWKMYVLNQGYCNAPENYIIIGSAPIEGWRPGTPIDPSYIKTWKENKAFVYDTKNGRYLIKRTSKTMWVFEKGWRKAFQKALNDAFRAKTLDELTDEDLEALADAMDKASDEEIKKAKARLEDASAAINNLRTQLIAQIREQDYLTQVVGTAPEKGPKDAMAAVEKIKRLSGIKAVEVKGSALHFFTERIYATPTKYVGSIKEGTVYDIGDFRIEIDIKTGAIAFYNLTPGMVKNSYQHPHVLSPNAPSLGEISANVPDMIMKLMLPELVQVLLRFLKSGNTDAGYMERLTWWPAVEKAKIEKPEPKATPAINLNEGVTKEPIKTETITA